MTTFGSFLYTLVIALISSGLYAQTSAPQSASALAIPETGDNLILVGSSMPDSLLYLRAGQILTESGFAINKTDSEQMTIQTEPRTIAKAVLSPYLVVSVVKGGVQITGFMESDRKKASQQTTAPTVISNSGTGKALMRMSFDAMSDYAQRLANSINGTVSYKKQQ